MNNFTFEMVDGVLKAVPSRGFCLCAISDLVLIARVEIESRYDKCKFITTRFCDDNDREGVMEACSQLRTEIKALWNWLADAVDETEAMFVKKD